MHRPRTLMLAGAIALALAHGAAAAPVPNALRFSVAVSQGGQPFNGTIDLQLQFFDAATGGAPVAGPIVIEDVPVQAGVGFFVGDFGAVNPLGNQDTYIGGGIRLGSSTGSFAGFSGRGRFFPGGFALHAQKIAPGIVGTAEIVPTQVQARVGSGCAFGQAIRQIGVDGSVVCEALGGGGGSITAINPGAGLAGGGSSGAVTLGVAPLGITAALLADGAVASAKIASDAIDGSKIADGSVGTPDINATQVQRRVAGNCAVGQAIRQVNVDGTVSCETAGGGGGWGLTGNSISSGQYLGSSNNLPLELRTNNTPALRLRSLNDPDGGAYGGGINTIATALGDGTNAANGAGSAVLGGGNAAQPQNRNVADGFYATVLGGLGNSAGGTTSLAAGRGAIVRNAAASGDSNGDEGSMVFADAQASSFISSGPNQFLVRAVGGVGINTNAPLAPLHVGSGIPAGFTAPSAGTRALLSASTGNADLSLVAPGSGSTAVRFSNGALEGALVFDGSTNSNGFDLLLPTVGRVLRAAGNGALSLGVTATPVSIEGPTTIAGTTNITGNLVVSGTITGANCCSVPSDRQLKQDIESIDSPLAQLHQLVGYRYRFSDAAITHHHLPSEPQIGFMAQDVEQVFPQWADDDPRGFMTVQLRGFDALLVEATREMEARRMEQDLAHEARLKALETENAELHAALRRIEAALQRN